MRKVRVIPILLLLLVFCSCFNDHKAENDVLRVGYHPNFGGSSAVAIAVKMGFFEEEGLDVDLVMYQSGPASIGGLMAGDVDISFLGHGAFGLAIESGMIIFALDSLSFAEEIIASSSSGIESLADLEGKKIAVPFSTSAENFLLSVLDYQQVDLSNIDMINMDIAGCVSAIANGLVDAVSVWAPYNTEIRQEMGAEAISIGDCMDYKGRLYFPMYWVADSDFVSENRQALLSFTKALLKALDWRKEHLDETVEIVGKFLGRSQEDLLLDIRTADWFDSNEVRRLLANGEVDQMFRSLLYAMEQRGRSHLSADMLDNCLDFSLLEGVLDMED